MLEHAVFRIIGLSKRETFKDRHQAEWIDELSIGGGLGPYRRKTRPEKEGR
ncbi:hypothetical protein AA0472_2452 [Acetobacter estunensis NRIC 0472]|nr:hypothetical protein AA0472_2452 [Acetobacter estunensis NRIC 0472]